jgi:hypothetical protein
MTSDVVPEYLATASQMATQKRRRVRGGGKPEEPVMETVVEVASEAVVDLPYVLDIADEHTTEISTIVEDLEVPVTVSETNPTFFSFYSSDTVDGSALHNTNLGTHTA